MANDRYGSFAELSAKERPGVDYKIVFCDRESSVTVIAPHGGKIEPGTSEVARALAGESYNLYLFEGLRRGSGELHITSHRFDEPVCLDLVAKSSVVIAIHGRKDDEDEDESVWLGGLDRAGIDCVAGELNGAGFSSRPPKEHDLKARQPNNICNRGSRGAGMQLELPRNLRNDLVRDLARMDRFIEAIRRAI